MFEWLISVQPKRVLPHLHNQMLQIRLTNTFKFLRLTQRRPNQKMVGISTVAHSNYLNHRAHSSLRFKTVHLYIPETSGKRCTSTLRYHTERASTLILNHRKTLKPFTKWQDRFKRVTSPIPSSCLSVCPHVWTDFREIWYLERL